ncbi:hypothetical protein [Streptomyces roseochromogenus]|uniref:Uncharacterized protein n=1 Tax=Streptomyces roseochromogenus subsp. oscitans DS 12.976 TaxID=1352936 RepID=V6KBZ5_STRRC|nr:hypothetical protein M878_20430 [Streptomyces roseochromogenus subsp. oscitans DS 12.976]
MVVVRSKRLRLICRSLKETVNTALREVLENRRRALVLTRLRASAEEGAFDLGLLEDKENYRR